MKAEYPIEGRWTSLKSKIDSAYGYLTCNPSEGLRLTLKIPRSAPPEDAIAATSQFFADIDTGVIEGFDADDKPITLYGCLVSSASSSQGMLEVSYDVSHAVSGLVHIPWASLTAMEFTFGMTSLRDWLSPPSFQSAERSGKLTEYRQASEFQPIQVSEALGMVFLPVNSISAARAQISYDEGVLLRLTYSQAALVSLVTNEITYRLENLFTLLTGSRVSLESAVFSELPNSNIPSCQKKILSNYVRGTKNRDNAFRVRSHFSDMGGRFGAVVAKWLDYYEDEDMRQVLELYASLTRFEFHMSAKFVFLAQTLEAYHASCGRYEQLQEPKHEIKVRCNRIRDSLSPEDAAWLKEKLAFCNNKTFHQRLVELVEDAPPEARTIVPDTEAFVAGVKHNRNAYTHRYGKASHKKRLPEGDLLWRLSHQMWHLLELLLLRDLGLQHLGGKVVHSYLDHRVL